MEIESTEKKFLNFREELTVFRGDLKEYYGFFVSQCESILKCVSENQVFNNREHAEVKQRLTMVSHEIRQIREEAKSNTSKNLESTLTIEVLANQIIETKKDISQSLRLLLPSKDFEAYKLVVEERARKLVYNCQDLNNKILTTDRYIDQFLPFRMIKEVSSFLEFLLPQDQAKKIEIMRKEKIKHLYA